MFRSQYIYVNALTSPAHDKIAAINSKEAWFLSSWFWWFKSMVPTSIDLGPRWSKASWEHIKEKHVYLGEPETERERKGPGPDQGSIVKHHWDLHPSARFHLSGFPLPPQITPKARNHNLNIWAPEEQLIFKYSSVDSGVILRAWGCVFILLHIFIGCLFVYLNVHCLLWHESREQRTTWKSCFCPSTIWNPGIELRSLDISASAFSRWAILLALFGGAFKELFRMFNLIIAMWSIQPSTVISLSGCVSNYYPRQQMLVPEQ